jgi:hypothetical protein
LKLAFKEGYQIPEILLFGAIIKRKHDKIGRDEYNDEKKFKTRKNPYSFEFNFNAIKRKVKNNEKNGKKVDQVPGADKMGDIQKSTEKVEPSDGKDKSG